MKMNNVKKVTLVIDHLSFECYKKEKFREIVNEPTFDDMRKTVTFKFWYNYYEIIDEKDKKEFDRLYRYEKSEEDIFSRPRYNPCRVRAKEIYEGVSKDIEIEIDTIEIVEINAPSS